MPATMPAPRHPSVPRRSPTPLERTGGDDAGPQRGPPKCFERWPEETRRLLARSKELDDIFHAVLQSRPVANRGDSDDRFERVELVEQVNQVGAIDALEDDGKEWLASRRRQHRAKPERL